MSEASVKTQIWFWNTLLTLFKRIVFRFIIIQIVLGKFFEIMVHLYSLNENKASKFIMNTNFWNC